MKGTENIAKLWGGERVFVKLLKKFCEERNVKIDFLLNDTWGIKLQKDEKVRFIFGFDFGLNSSSVSKILDDKAAVCAVLDKENIPHIHHFLFLRPNSPAYDETKHSLDTALDYFKKYKDVILKPNFGTSGFDILRAQTEDEFVTKFAYIQEKHRAVALSPFENIDFEVRATVLDSEILLMYKKIKNDEFLFNLSHGAKAVSVSSQDLLWKKVEAEVLKIVRAIPFRLANVDFAVCASGQIKLLELNSGVAFERYYQTGEKAKAEVESALHKIFTKLIYD